MGFPIDLNQFKAVPFKLSQSELGEAQRRQLKTNIEIVRDSLVFFTALANCKGLGGHTGGAYDIVPELLIVDGFMKGNKTVHPIFFDEAGHRVAIQYMMAALNGYMPVDALLHYREFDKGLYGHPERKDDAGIFFSSGRLGHLWSHVNGVAEAFPDRIVVMFGSDGSQQEGADAEAARYAVARNLNVKLMIDDNNVTIAGHPADYMQGFDVGKTLAGHGLAVDSGDGEDLDALFSRIQACLVADGPVALINKRLMAAGVPGIEGSTKGHDVIPVPMAIDYLTAKKHTVAVEILQHTTGNSNKTLYLGSTQEKSKNRDEFGKIICGILQGMENPESKALVVDSDLEGSCGLHHIRKAFPDLYVHGGIMERNNFSVAAGFGATPGRQGIFGTFAAFQEMLISEITMARLNRANVLAHFSHSGVDDMADNTCHFGINNFFADNGLPENDTTRLYFPADALQMRAIIETVYHNPGLKFIFSTRSATPLINDDAGALLYRDGYTFLPDKDEIVRKGTAGYIVSYGEMLYRCLDVVEKLKAEGIDTGLINKPTLNVVDPEMLARVGNSPFVLVVETQNTKTGLGSRYGTWLLENGYTPKYGAMGTTKEGEGGLWEQIPYQGMGSEQIIAKLKALMAHCQ